MYELANWREFDNFLNRALIDDIEDLELNNFSKKIASSIKNAADNAIPKSKSTSRLQNYPNHIVDLIKTKSFWQRRFKNNPNQWTASKPKEFQILIGEAIDAFCYQKWTIFLNRMGPNPLSTKPFWKRINHLRGKSNSREICSI